MNPTLITDLLTYALPSGFLAGTVTWLVSRRKRRNDMLADMQRSIDLLCEKYNDVLQENVTLRREKADWLVAQQELLRKIDKLTREVEGLRKNFNRKTQKKTDETSPTKKTARAAAAAAPAGRVRRKAGVQADRLCCGTLGGQPDERGGGTSAGRPGAWL